MNPYRPRKRRCTVVNLLYWTLVLVLAAAVFHLQSLYLSCRATSNHDSAAEEMHKALNEELQSAKQELAKATLKLKQQHPLSKSSSQHRYLSSSLVTCCVGR